MNNQIKDTQDKVRKYGDTLKNIKNWGVVPEEIQENLLGVMSFEEIADFVSKRKEKARYAIQEKRGAWKVDEWFQKIIETRKKDIALIKDVAKKMGITFGEAYNLLHGGDEFKKKTSEKKESWKIIKERLLNKPNMTAKDKEGMQKSIDYLVGRKMDTLENLKKLEAIIYTNKYIEIGGVKRSREDITAKPDGKNIFQHNDVTYFKRSENMIKEQNELLAEQGMKIPLDSDYRKSMEALPGKYLEEDHYEWWNILSFIMNMWMEGYCSVGGTLSEKGKLGNRWSASPKGNRSARHFVFDKDGGLIHYGLRDFALPIRTVFK